MAVLQTTDLRLFPYKVSALCIVHLWVEQVHHYQTIKMVFLLYIKLILNLTGRSLNWGPYFSEHKPTKDLCHRDSGCQWSEKQLNLGFAIPWHPKLFFRPITLLISFFISVVAYPTVTVSLQLSLSHKCSLSVEVLLPTDSMFIEIDDLWWMLVMLCSVFH